MSGRGRDSSGSVHGSAAAYETLPQDADAPVDDEQLLPAAVPDDDPLATPPRSISFLHFLLGAAMLLPWNAMITAAPYFKSRLGASPVADVFSFYLSSTLTVANFLFLGHATLTAQTAALAPRIRGSSFLIAGIFALLTISARIAVPPAPFLIGVLALGAAQAAAGAYLSAGVFALGALFGPRVLQALMAGQAAVGVLVSLMQLLVTADALRRAAAGDGAADAEAGAAFVFFAFSTAFVLAVVVLYAWVARGRAYANVVRPFEARKVALQADLPLAHMWDVAKLNGKYNAAVAIVFIVTLTVFPAITGSVGPMAPTKSAGLAHPLIFSAVHFLAFNVGDWCGRFACAFPALHIWGATRLLYLALARLVFLPLFLACNIAGRVGPAAPLIGSDAAFLALMVAFGATNGYAGSMALMAAAAPAHNVRLRAADVDAAATIASFCIIGGLALGSLLSFVLRAAV